MIDDQADISTDKLFKLLGSANATIVFMIILNLYESTKSIKDIMELFDKSSNFQRTVEAILDSIGFDKTCELGKFIIEMWTKAA